jgi:hypothetical protein
VDSIMDAVLAGEPVRLLPSGLAQALRRRIPHAFNRDALASVVQRASTVQGADDAGSDD